MNNIQYRKNPLLIKLTEVDGRDFEEERQILLRERQRIEIDKDLSEGLLGRLLEKFVEDEVQANKLELKKGRNKRIIARRAMKKDLEDLKRLKGQLDAKEAEFKKRYGKAPFYK